MSMVNIESNTCFDRLPTEIIFMIFNYLSNNEIIYTFFHFSQRLNNLLLQNQRYLNHLDLPTTNLDTWENILSVIRYEIKSLNITTIDLSFSLTLFTNLKSIIISSSFGFPEEHLKSILESNQFKHLHSLEIKESQTSYRFPFGFLPNQYYILENVFRMDNSLQTFQYPSVLAPFARINPPSFATTINLHSLTLALTRFKDIFSLMSYTPNLKYLNIQSQLSYLHKQEPVNKVEVKLKQLYVKLDPKIILPDPVLNQLDFDQLINGIKQFSSSLTYLSLDLVDLHTNRDGEFPFNHIKLQELLESTIELKQFHLYAKLTKK